MTISLPSRCLSSIRAAPGASALAAQPRRWSGPRRRSCRGQRQTSAKKCEPVWPAPVSHAVCQPLERENLEEVCVGRRHDRLLGPDQRRARATQNGKQTAGAFVGRCQELVFTPRTTPPGHGRERVFTQAKQVLCCHVGPRPVTKTEEAAQSSAGKHGSRAIASLFASLFASQKPPHECLFATSSQERSLCP